MGTGGIVLFVVAILVLSTTTYFVLTNNNSTETPENETLISNETANPPPQNNTVPVNETNEDSFNVSELHWAHMPLTYKIEDKTNCLGKSLENLESAFSLIEESSPSVSFVESSGTTDITVSCVDKKYLLDKIENYTTCKNYTLSTYSASFAGWEILDDDEYFMSVSLKSQNSTDNVYKVCFVDKGDTPSDINWDYLEESKIEFKGSEIQSAAMNIYKPNEAWSSCAKFPANEVHDVLHILGFAHSETPKFDDYFGWREKDASYFRDIMFSHTYCPYKTKIDEKYISCLNKIYSASNSNSEGSCEGVNFLND